MVEARGIRPSGIPIWATTCIVEFAMTRALGSAKPTSSEASITSLLAINLGSSPPTIMRANQCNAASASEPLTDLMKALMKS